MKTGFLPFVLSLLLLVPCALHADEVEIVLTEVAYTTPTTSYASLDNCATMDGSRKKGDTPPCKTCFRATVNNNTLSINKLELDSPLAQVIVATASGQVMWTQIVYDSMVKTFSSTGVYVLRIETGGGALVGHFIVQ